MSITNKKTPTERIWQIKNHLWELERIDSKRPKNLAEVKNYWYAKIVEIKKRAEAVTAI